MALRRRFGLPASAAIAAVALLAGCASSGGGSASSGSSTSASKSGPVAIGVDLTYNNTAFWSAYINYETQYAKQLNIKLLGPLLSAASASLQNQQIEELVNEGAKAVIVNPETATSLGPAISYAAAHHVKLISVDTIVGVGKVYMVVRASNLLYGLDACAYISSFAKSGYVLDLEGDLTSSNGADRANASNPAWPPTIQGSRSSRTHRVDRRDRGHRPRVGLRRQGTRLAHRHSDHLCRDRAVPALPPGRPGDLRGGREPRGGPGCRNQGGPDPPRRLRRRQHPG